MKNSLYNYFIHGKRERVYLLRLSAAVDASSGCVVAGVLLVAVDH